MNKTSERYNTKVEVPINIILGTIFSDDNHDVETLGRWAEKYGFVDLVEKEGKKYYQLQSDYTEQAFYLLLDKEERNQYDYAEYLLDKNEKLQQENKQLKDNWNKLKEHIQGCLDEVLENDVYDRTSYEQGVIAGLESSLFKLEELENGDNNE